MADEAAEMVEVVLRRCCDRKTEFCNVLFHLSAVSRSLVSHIICNIRANIETLAQIGHELLDQVCVQCNSLSLGHLVLGMCDM